MKQRIKDYILSELLGGTTDRELGYDDDLLNNGTVDSLGVMRLVAFVEGEAGINIPPEDLILENFESINSIDSYLSERQK